MQLDESGALIAGTEIEGAKDSELLITIPRAGVWQLLVGPDGLKFLNMNLGSSEALRMVEQWGAVKWKKMYWTFFGCRNMVFAEGIDTPDLSGVTSMEGMFDGCASFNQPLTGWNFAEVTRMSYMFRGCKSFNQSVEGWEVGKVEDMYGMFRECTAFNQSLASWVPTQLKRIGLEKCGMTMANYSATILAWHANRLSLQEGGEVYADKLYYNEAAAPAREELMDRRSWKFYDDRQGMEPAGVEIVGAPALVPLNEPRRLVAKVLPSEAPQLIVWSVQEPGATMEGNRFTATEEGDYTVKAASLENLEKYATVTIAARLVQVTKVTIKNKPTEMLLYESRRFEATVEPEGARTAVTWSRCIV